MKPRFLLFALFILTGMMVSAQTFVYEDFSSGQMPPAGWTISGLPAQWSVSQSANAGGTAPEGMFTYVQGTTTTRLICPVVNTTGLTSVRLSFKHFYDWYSNPAPKLGVATRSSATGTWTSVWEVTPTANIGPETKDITISNADVGSATFQFCFYLNGNMYNLDYWYVDDVLLLNPLPKDAFLTTISQTPTHFSDPAEVKGTIMNVGLAPITDLDIVWRYDEKPNELYMTGFTGLNIQTLTTYDFTSAMLLNPPIGAHDITVWIGNVNGSKDDNQANDTLRKTVNKVCHSMARKPLFEEFTSSTCSPCAQFNSSFVPWCNQHENDITLLKYQMNWPGVGDPYYTEEGGVRRDYYGVTWVPWLECNGGFVNTDIGSVQAAYDQETAKIGMMSVASSHTLTGHVMTVNLTVLPFANFNGCHLYVAVYEKVTHNNVSTNGETSFEHVMMKMMPDAGGTGVNLTDRQPYTFTNTVDLTGTHVEEWTDLMVVTWIQDDNSREIYQSFYSVENGVFATEDRLSDIKVSGVSIPGFTSNSFDYVAILPGGTVTVPDVQGIPIDPNETVIVVPALTLPGTTTIDVFAQNNIAHNLYTVDLTFATGVPGVTATSVTAYPNPASDKVFIRGAENAQVSLISPSGVCVRNINNFTGTHIDLNGLEKGMYLLKIVRTDGQVVQKKIVVL
jgi:hypothetical protein